MSESESGYKLMMPQAIWEGFDDTAPLEIDSRDTDYGKRMVFTALRAADGAVRVQTDVYLQPDYDSAPNILIVPEYPRLPEAQLIRALFETGANVIVPDYSKVSENSETVFPDSYAYGEWAKAGDHIKKCMPSALETSQYLYSVIIKRTMRLIKTHISDGKIILTGLGDAVEVAMQVEGSGGGADALACLNGSGYREYIKHNRYGGEDLEIDEERMCWLTGIASVAYAKYIRCPTFIAVGSNAHLSDIDRLQNLKSLLAAESVHIVISPRAGDFLLPEAFRSLIIWINAVIKGTINELPDVPELDIRINEDGIPYFDVDCDPASIIRRVNVYYATKEYSHELRDWKDKRGISVSYNEYIAQAEEYSESDPLFAFGEVEYESGLTLTSLVGYMELSGQPVKAPPKKDTVQTSTGVIFDPMGENNFVEDFSGTVMMKSGMHMAEIPGGLVGLTSDYGRLKTFHFCPSGAAAERLLQIELYSDRETEVEVGLMSVAGGLKRYSAVRKVPAGRDMFVSVRLRLNDFKETETLNSLQSWDGVKTLTIYGNNLIIGNILFI